MFRSLRILALRPRRDRPQPRLLSASPRPPATLVRDGFDLELSIDAATPSCA